MDIINVFPRLGPYVGVTRDKTINFKINRKHSRAFRVIVYGAYDAFGLIGSEKNGIAVLDEDNRSILCDEIAREDSGYFGPSKRQLALFDDITALSWPHFRDYINESCAHRLRYKI
jgi:hypothetical protein